MTITSAFHAKSTALEVVRHIDLTGRHVLVTGGASGLGLETSRALVAAGATVTLAVRNLEQGQQAAARFRTEFPGAAVSVARLDLGDLAGVRQCATDWLATGQPLDILINNAAIMACPLTRDRHGWEAQFATNHLGHFALTTALLPALRQAGARHGDARVVALSSSGHKLAGVDFDDLHFANAATTTSGPPTARRRAPTRCSRWACTGAKPPTASPPMPCTRAAS